MAVTPQQLQFVTRLLLFTICSSSDRCISLKWFCVLTRHRLNLLTTVKQVYSAFSNKILYAKKNITVQSKFENTKVKKALWYKIKYYRKINLVESLLLVLKPPYQFFEIKLGKGEIEQLLVARHQKWSVPRSRIQSGNLIECSPLFVFWNISSFMTHLPFYT